MMNIEYFNPEIAKSIGIIEATFFTNTLSHYSK